MIYKGTIIEGSATTLMVRMSDATGNYVVQSDVDEISFKVFDLTTEEEIYSSGALDVTDAVFNTLQTDDRWREDSIGYNIVFVVPGSATVGYGNKNVRVELKIVLTPDPYVDLTTHYIPFDYFVNKILSV